MMFEPDHPHLDATWPLTHPTAGELFGHLDPVAVRKLDRGGAARRLGLDR